MGLFDKLFGKGKKNDGQPEKTYTENTEEAAESVAEAEEAVEHTNASAEPEKAED